MAKKVVKKVAKKPVKKATKVVKIVKKSEPVKKVVAPKIVKIPYNYSDRINRVLGQVGGVQRMIEAEKNRVDILIQLKAVRSAIKSLEMEILEDYLQIAAVEIINEGELQRSKKIADLKKIFLKFE